MEHLNNEEQKKTMYFLEWIAQESGFTENQILSNMKPSKQRWQKIKYFSITEFIDSFSIANYVIRIFHWENSFLKPDEFYWDKIHSKWGKLLYEDEYNIKFSRYPINNWKIVKPIEKVKIKSKKLKI